MDLHERIRALAELMAEADLAELEVKHGEEVVRLVRALPGAAAQAGAAESAAGNARQSSADGASGAGGTESAAAAVTAVVAPMAGTFYAAPEPGAEPYLRPGQTVQPGDVVCIIESMKMMNEIKAESGGVCVSIAAQDGQPVGRGDVLMRLG